MDAGSDTESTLSEGFSTMMTGIGRTSQLLCRRDPRAGHEVIVAIVCTAGHTAIGTRSSSALQGTLGQRALEDCAKAKFAPHGHRGYTERALG